LLGNRIEFSLRHAQGFRLVAQHTFRRAFDVLFQSLNLCIGALLKLLRLLQETSLRQFLRGRERLIEIALAVLPQRIVKLF
jgi:hypothetical protein